MYIGIRSLKTESKPETILLIPTGEWSEEDLFQEEEVIYPVLTVDEYPFKPGDSLKILPKYPKTYTIYKFRNNYYAKRRSEKDSKAVLNGVEVEFDREYYFEKCEIPNLISECGTVLYNKKLPYNQSTYFTSSDGSFQHSSKNRNAFILNVPILESVLLSNSTEDATI